MTNNQRKLFDDNVNNLIEKFVQKHLHMGFKRNLKNNLSESRSFKIDQFETEKVYKTSSGEVRIDIVLTINNEELFVEPFFTSAIDYSKERKLALLNIPSLSIDLSSFIKFKGFGYNKNDLKSYLGSKNSKRWIFNRDKYIEKYSEEYYDYVLKQIDEQRTDLDFHFSKIKEIDDLQCKVEKLYFKIEPYQNKISELNAKISEIKKEIGIS